MSTLSVTPSGGGVGAFVAGLDLNEDIGATWHYAVNDYHGARRLMHRITLDGVALAA